MVGRWMFDELEQFIKEGTNIFNPQAKVLANVENAIEFVESQNTSPVLIEVDPSNACNHACSFCLSSYIHFDKYKGTETFSRALMPRDMLMELCEDFVKMKVKAVNWTGGGEPTLNKHLKEAIQYCGEHGIKMGMFTNGTLFEKNDLYETLVDNMTWVRISIDAGTEKTYNDVRIPKGGADWNSMLFNVKKLIEVNNSKGNKIDIGAGFVMSPDTYHEIVDFANVFKDLDITYCQYKPEIVIREDGGVQRELDFWKGKVEPLLDEAKDILGDKFQSNAYKFEDLVNDRENFGREYKKCLGSQISPCIGADGHVYVCTNHRGWKQYSYGCLYDGKRFEDIWNDLVERQRVMYQIEEKECFSNCTKLCKPHESNKMMWYIHETYNDLDSDGKELFKDKLLEMKSKITKQITHAEFI